MGVLHTGFLHIGTKIEVTLARRAGGDDVIHGTIVYCVHVAGSFHHLGVRFDQKINPQHYVSRESLEQAEGNGTPTTLAGKLLHFDDSEVDRKLLAHYIKGTKIELTSMTSSENIVDAIKQNAFDLVLCEGNFKQTTGEALIANLRAAGYAGRVIIITSETAPDRLRGLKQAGATGMLGKPYDQTKLFSLIGPFLKRASADSNVVSALAAQPEMKSLIERYVANVQQLANDIEGAIRDNQLDRMRQICSSLKSSGTSYGFAMLSEMSKETLRSLDATMSLTDSNAQIRKLLDLCKRVIVA